MPLTAQAKLLRVIENREIIPVGGTQPIKVETRIIAATNADLRKRVQEKQFREDLFFRLNVLNINISPLRERREDIVPLAKHILGKLARETGKDLPGLSKDAVDYLMEASWQGNVRELANSIERAVIVSQGNLITAADFPTMISPMTRVDAVNSTPNLDGMKLEDVERTLLLRALERSGNNLTRAARLLGMGRGALRYRLEKHGISAREPNGEI
jgi:two-component system NtrC family response regulator